MTILAFPIEPTRHIAEVNYEQAKEQFNIILKHFNARREQDQLWFREAQERRSKAFDLLMRKI